MLEQLKILKDKIRACSELHTLCTAAFNKLQDPTSVDVLHNDQSLKEIVRILVTSSCTRSSLWFECLLFVGDLNASIFEEFGVDLWKACWLEVHQLDADAVVKQHALVLRILTTFARLRQLPKFHATIIQAVKESQAQLEDYYFPQTFVEKYSSYLNQVSVNQVIDIWNCLAAFIEEWVTSLEKRKSDKGAVILNPMTVVEIFQLFLQHIGIGEEHDLMRLEIPTKKTELLLERLLKLYASKFCDTHIGLSALTLSAAFGDFILLQKMYKTKLFHDEDEDLQNSLNITDWRDLSLLHRYICSAEWLKIVDASLDLQDNRLKRMLVQLLIQNVRGLILLSKNNVKRKIISKTFIHIMKMINITLLLEPVEIEAEPVDIDVWHLVVNHSPYFLPSLKQKEMRMFCADVLDICMVFKARKQSENEISDDLIKAATIAEDFLRSPFFLECRKLQSEFVTVLCNKCHGVFKSRKRKSGDNELCSSSLPLRIIGMLQEHPEVWMKYANTVPKQDATSGQQNEMWKMVEAACEILNSLLDGDVNTVAFSEKLDPSKALIFCELLNYLPLEYLMEGNQLRCLLMLLVLILSLEAVSSTSLKSKSVCCKLMMDAATVITAVLKGARSVWLFSFVHRGPLVKRMMTLFQYLLQKNPDLAEDDTFWKCAENFLQNLFLLALSHLKEMPFVKIRGLVSEITSNDSGTDVSLLTCTLLLNQIVKIMKKPFLPKETKESGQDLADQLASYLVKTTGSQFHNKSDTMQVYQTTLALKGFALAMIHFRNKGDVSGLCTVLGDSVKRRQKFLRNVLSLAISQLKLSMGGINNNISESSLKAMREVFMLRNMLDQSLTSNIVVDCWNGLFAYIVEKAKSYCWVSLTDAKNPSEEVDQKVIYASQTKCEVPSSSSWVKVTEMEQSTLAAVIDTSLQEELKLLIEYLFSKLECEANVHDIQGSVLLWSIFAGLSTKQGGHLMNHLSKDTVHKVLYLVFNITKSYAGKAEFLQIVAPALHLFAMFLKKGREIINPGEVVLSLELCMLASHEDICSQRADVFASVLSSILCVFDQIFIHHKHVLVNACSAIISCLSTLIKLIVQAGNEDLMNAYSETTKQNLESCAQHFGKLLNMLTEHKKELSNVVPYLVAQYICEVQHITLHPVIKAPLLSSIYRLLPLCSDSANNVIQACLSQGGREVFKSLLADFNKFHKYKGRI